MLDSTGGVAFGDGGAVPNSGISFFDDRCSALRFASLRVRYGAKTSTGAEFSVLSRYRESSGCGVFVGLFGDPYDDFTLKSFPRGDGCREGERRMML